MYLHAVGAFHPESVLTNAFLEELGIDTSDAWIVDRVGIRTRHTVLPLDYIRETKNADLRAAAAAATVCNAEAGARAARVALARAGLGPGDVKLVVSGGCAPDECIPAEASRVAERLGVDAPAFDVQSACSSFCVQLAMLEGMRPERLPDFVLLVNPESLTRSVDYRDRAACVLFGDCATAAVVSPRVPGPWRVADTVLRGDPSGAGKISIGRFTHFQQQGADVQRFAIKRATELFLELRGRWLARHAGRTAAELAFIGHQANLRMLESVARRCEVPEGKHLQNVDRRGNVGASGAPSVLAERWEDPALGDAVALCVVGSGLTWAGALLERVAPLQPPANQR